MIISQQNRLRATFVLSAFGVFSSAASFNTMVFVGGTLVPPIVWLALLLFSIECVIYSQHRLDMLERGQNGSTSFLGIFSRFPFSKFIGFDVLALSGWLPYPSESQPRPENRRR